LHVVCKWEVLQVTRKGRTGQTSLDQAATTTVTGTFFRSMAGHPLTVPVPTIAGTVPPGGLIYVDAATAARLRSQVDQWRAVTPAVALKAAKAHEYIHGWAGTIGDLERAAATTT